MFFIHAKDDGFLETVATLFEEIRNFLCDQLCAVIDNERAIEVSGVINAVLDLIAVTVGLAPLRTPGVSWAR